MSLTHTSDDCLAQILSLLSYDDVCRLMATGSRRLIARIAQNIHELEWTFSRPTLFPSFCFTFAKLRSLTIRIDCSRGHPTHISMKDRTMLPLAPMASLESLTFDFQLSSLIFEPQPAHGGLPLSYFFPRLTSLSISSLSEHLLPDDWAESLPKSLLDLSLDIQSVVSRDTEIDPSTFYSLPESLQRLEFGASMTIKPGKLNLRRFADLRVLCLHSLSSWEALDSLPDSLEELHALFLHADGDEDEYDDTKNAVLPISKLPPKLRVLALNGPGLTLDLDANAPSTLEIVRLSAEYPELTLEKFIQLFPTKSLRKASLSLPMSPSLMEALPSLESIQPFFVDNLASLEVLPRTLKRLSLFPSSESEYLPVKHLSPKLKQFHGYVYFAQDVADLPRTISKLGLVALREDNVPALSSSAWLTLPPRLLKLDIELHLFDSEKCLFALPETLGILIFSLRQHCGISRCAEMIERITFPKAMQDTLRSFRIVTNYDDRHDNPEKRINILVSKLASFSRLHTLDINASMRVNNETLSNLPKTLTFLEARCFPFENFGLPLDGGDRFESDWKEGAFSKLPEGLVHLKLNFSSESAYDIHFGVFSRLPSRLASLELYTHRNICNEPKKFIAALPKRLSRFQCAYAYPKTRGKSPKEIEVILERRKDFEKNLEEALNEYYSDPFWTGFRRGDYRPH